MNWESFDSGELTDGGGEHFYCWRGQRRCTSVSVMDLGSARHGLYSWASSKPLTKPIMHLYAWCLWRSQEDVRSPGVEVIDCLYCESNPDPLEEQPVFFNHGVSSPSPSRTIFIKDVEAWIFKQVFVSCTGRVEQTCSYLKWVLFRIQRAKSHLSNWGSMLRRETRRSENSNLCVWLNKEKGQKVG